MKVSILLPTSENMSSEYIIQVTKETEEKMRKRVETMVKLMDPRLTDEEAKMIIDYLAEEYGK